MVKIRVGPTERALDALIPYFSINKIIVHLTTSLHARHNAYYGNLKSLI